MASQLAGSDRFTLTEFVFQTGNSVVGETVGGAMECESRIPPAIPFVLAEPDQPHVPTYIGTGIDLVPNIAAKRVGQIIHLPPADTWQLTSATNVSTRYVSVVVNMLLAGRIYLVLHVSFRYAVEFWLIPQAKGSPQYEKAPCWK